ncbi:hypothetical protein THAOC_08821 [Thalassiosira oceanica]|uniref:AP2/ERF domain-containing protein n=1 Tax=Thalassiosira oceanica TaxID=159749 RepID=K0T8Z9_THAOC|nr:hypothetical protein THAOC_08821 [Thalassiosira oceanica]|eukprot:EJK69881.1 hypothetical protein THAOC_08821 [Thalassiosira oceanica]
MPTKKVLAAADVHAAAANSGEIAAPSLAATSDASTTEREILGRQGVVSSAPESSAIGNPRRKKRRTGGAGGFSVDLFGVPPQPPILKNEISSHYNDNSRRRDVSDASSKYAGVYRSGNKWKAQMYIQGAVRSLGYYTCELEAAVEYARAAFKYKRAKSSPLLTYGGLDLSGVPPQPLIHNGKCKSGFAGVKAQRNARWEARILGKNLGTYNTKEEAASVYARAKFYFEQGSKDKKSQKDSNQNSNQSKKDDRSVDEVLGGIQAGKKPVIPGQRPDPEDWCEV